jgi:hypothetical protein
MNQIRDLAEALVDALDKECRDSHAALPEWLRTEHTGDLCLACLLQGLIDRLEIHPSPEVNALSRELRLLKPGCDGWHEDCC